MLAAALIVAGLVVMFLVLRYMLCRLREDLRREVQEQVDALYMKIRLREPIAAAWPESTRAASPMANGSAAAEATNHTAPVDSPGSLDCPQAPDQVSPEALAVITETTEAFLGKKIRVRSAKLLQSAAGEIAAPPAPQTVAGPWAQEGRALVQGSHDLVQGRMSAGTAQRAASSLRGLAFEATDCD
jgi:hypothetical protein